MTDKSIQAFDEKDEDFLKNLRTATAPMHTALEATRLSRSLLDPESTLHEYTMYMTAMQQVMTYFENNVLPMLKDVVKDISDRHKLPAIKDDIVYLTSKKQDVPSLPAFKPVENPRDIDMALGYMYVLEGSVLGGRVILKQLSLQLGINEVNGGKYFAGYGADTGRKWRSFLEVLANYAAANQSGDNIIRGAIKAFTDIENYFEKIST